MPVEENAVILSQWWEKVQGKKEARRYIRVVLLVGLMMLLAAASGCAGGGADQASGGTTAGSKSAPAGAETTGARAETGTITGRVTDEDTGEPLSDVYITAGWETFQYAAITDADGRYTVPNVPVGEPAPVLGFHEGGYRYHNSGFDDNLDVMLSPGETYTYDFSLTQLDPEGQPEVSSPSITPDTAAPGETVTFGLTARDGEGGLSSEVFAANPEIGRLVLLKPAGGENEYSAEFTIPADTPPGEYTFAFFTASNECYVNGEFPMLTLTVTQ